MAEDLIVLAGDVGGTNTRLGIAGSGIGVTGLQRFENRHFANLSEVLRAYLAKTKVPFLSSVCLAVASAPGDGKSVALDRPWSGTLEDLRRSLPLREDGHIDIVNDLVGQGLAVPVLSSGQLESLRPGRMVGGQTLVVGVGTGFNVCLTIGSEAVSAELGQASLPAPVLKELAMALPKEGGEFLTVEDLFSGQGLARFHRALTGEDAADAAKIVAVAGDTESAAARTVASWARLLGLFVRELVPAYLPKQGIFFAGSVAKSVLGASSRQDFLSAFSSPFGLLDVPAAEIPLWLITDDAAGVSGAARRAFENAGKAL